MNNEQMTIEEKMMAVASLKGKLEEEFVGLGQLLSEMKRAKTFKVKGFKSFKEFVEDSFGFSSSTANKIISNYELYIEKLEVDELTVLSIGIDTLNLIKPIVSKASYQDSMHWIEKARTMSKEELRDEIKEQKEVKQMTSKEILVEQFKETFVMQLNIANQKEMMFKIALYFQDMDLEIASQIIKKAQQQFEE